MWLLGRLLPLIIGEKVPRDDAHWACFINLLRITTISTAQYVTEQTIETLEMIIEDYLALFNQLYPLHITPKLHYLLHLPDQLKQ